MSGDKLLILIVLLILALLVWRWLNPGESPEERSKRLEQEERTRQQQAEAERRRQEAEAEARRVAEADRVRRQEEEQKARAQIEQERASFRAVPIASDIQRDMREFLNSGEFFGEEHSPLAYVGYKVGKTNGLPTQERRRRLRACLQIQIPKELASHYNSWGGPVTYSRHSAMCKHLTMLADMRRNRRNFEVAVGHWEDDLEWLKTEHGNFFERLRRAKI